MPDMKLVVQIAERAVMTSQADIVMTVYYVNEACPLDLPGLLKADDFDFLHDLAGMIENLDRRTGKLLNCFRPRFALRREEE